MEYVAEKDANNIILNERVKALEQYHIDEPRYLEEMEPIKAEIEDKLSPYASDVTDLVRFCLNHKFASSEAFRNELERSNGKYIVEDESNRRKKPDSWGAILDTATNEYYGKNIMGRLLMELRDKGKLEYNEFELW